MDEKARQQGLINFKQFYQRLKKLGFDREFVTRVALPDWWCFEYEQQRGAIVHAISYASRRLNIDRDSLAYAKNTPTFNK